MIREGFNKEVSVLLWAAILVGTRSLPREKRQPAGCEARPNNPE